MEIGPTELLIVLVIVIVLFGAGRIANIGRDLGAAIREFRKGFSEPVDIEAEEARKS